MSTVDNRVVRMQFDNAQFEQGVARSMKTLDMLNEKLQFKEGAKGLSSLLVTIEGVSSKSANAAINALDRVSDYTTTILGMMAQKVKSQFADKIVAAIESIPTKAMSQIKTGGWNRAMNIANAQFQIEGLKFSWDAVRKAADYAVTDTAYGLDAAAKAASQLAASGVDFEQVLETDAAGNNLTQMHKSLRAISGVAAMTNSSYEDIAHTFTRIAGQGRVMGEDLNSLASRGLNAAATLAKALNTTESEVRDMVSKGAIDFQMFSEAMDEAYGEHAKEANKTFSGALSNMKAALSRIGAIFAQPVIDKTNTFFISVTNRIKEFQKALNDTTGYKLTEKGLENIKKKAQEAANARKDLTTANARESFVEAEVKRLKDLALGEEVKKSLDTGDVESFSIIRFAGHFAEAWESAVKAASTIVDSLDLSWFKDIATFLDNIAIKAKSFFDGITDYFNNAKDKVEEAAKVVQNLTDITFEDFKIIQKVMDGTLGIMEERWDAIDKIMGKEGEGTRIQGYIDQLAAVEYSYEKAGWTADWIKKKEKEQAEAVNKTTESIAKQVAEAKKEAYVATQSMSAEEALYSTIAYWLGVTKNSTNDVKKVISNSVKSISILGSNVLKVFSYFNAIGVNFRLDNITKEISSVSDSMLGFVESLKISQESVDSFLGPVSMLAEDFMDLYQSFMAGAKEAFEFAAACMTAEESLEELSDKGDLSPLQTTVISVLRVLKNLWKTVTNIAKAIASVVKPIVRAFKNVFDPSGIASGVADFSEGMANLSEKLIISEDAAKALEVVFGGLFSIVQKVATIFTKLVGGISKFVTSLRKTKNATKETRDAIKDVEEAGEKTESIFDSLKKIFEKFAKKIQALPSKFEELKKKINEQEGVQRLKKNFEALWENIKSGLTNSLEPLKNGLAEVAEETGGEGTTAIGAFADGIGKVAGKISDFIESIPGYITQVENFFDRVKKKAEDFVDKLHITNLFDSMGNAFDVTAKTEGSITDKVKAFFSQIYDKITEVVESIDWKKVTKAGLLGLIMGNLFNFLSITNKFKTLLTNIAAIPKSISGIFTSLSGLMTQGKKTLKSFTDIYVFTAIVQALGTLVAAVLLLADLNEEKLKTGLAAMTWIGLIIAVLAKSIRGTGDFTKIVEKTGNQIDKSTKGIININQSISGPVGIAVAIVAFAGAVYLVLKAVSEVIDVSKTATDAKIGNALKILILTFAVLGGLMAGLVAAVKLLDIGKNKGVAFVGIASSIITIGAAVWLIANSIKGLSGINIDDGAVLVVIGIISVLTLFMIAVGAAARWADPKGIILMGAVLAILSGVMLAIIGELIIMSGALAIYSATGQGDSVMAALGVIVTVIAALGLFAYLVGKGSKDMKDAKPVATLLLSMAGVIFVICKAFESISNTIKDADDPLVTAGAAGVMMISLLMLTVGVSKMLKELQSHRGFLKDDGAKSILALAAVILVIGASMLMIGATVAIMAKAVADNPGQDVLGPVIIILLALLGVMAFIVHTLVQTDNKKIDQALDTLLAISITFVAVGVAMMAIAKAAQMIGGLPKGAFTSLAVALGGIMAGVIVLSYFAGSDKGGAGLNKVATFVMAFAISLLVMAGAVALLGVGLGILGPGLAALGLGIERLSKALEENKIAAIIAIAIIAAVIYMAIKLTTTVAKVVTVISKILEIALTLIQSVIDAISGFIQKFRNSSSAKWFKELPTKTKLVMASVIVGIAGAILSATPEVLANLKKVIQKIVYFIIDIIPTLVDTIFDILLRLINALADTIRKNSAAVANAVWNVIEALLEVIIDLIGQGIVMMVGYAAKLLDLFGIDTSFLDGITDKLTQQFSKVKASLRSGLDAANTYASTTEILTEAFSGLDASMNNVTDDILKQNGVVKDAAGNFVKLEDATGNVLMNMADIEKSKGLSRPTSLDTSIGGGGGGIGDKIKDAIGLGDSSINMDAFSWNTADLAQFNMEDAAKRMGVDNSGMDFMNIANLDADSMGEFGMEGADGYTNEFAIEMASDNSKEQVSDATDELMDSAADVVAARKQELVDNTIPKMMHDVYSSLVVNTNNTKYGYGPGAYSKFVVDIIEEGINRNLGKIQASGENMAETLDEGFVGPMKISSPSKVFYENGLYCVMGLQNGVQQNTNLATGAMSNLSNQMIESFGNPLEYAARIASGEIEYDPTIRPVMDMTTARRGALDINSMFRNQSISLGGLSGQIAYDMTTINGSNAAVVSEIKALREDMDYMTGEITSMQIVMDTGALVGSTVGAYDKALGQKQVYSRRGN